MKKLLVWCILLCFTTTGCASYRARSLPSSNPTSLANHETQDGLTVGVQFFNASESKKIFGVKKVSRVSQPTYIVIDNRTNDTYEFNKRTLNPTAIPAEEIASECNFNTAARATTYGVAGIFIWPLLIPAVVDGVGSSQANQRMENDYMYKEIKDDRISPNGLLNGVVFLGPMKDGEELTVRLQNIRTNDVKLFSFKK